MIIDELENKKLIQPPEWMSNSIQFLVKMGSHSYGIANSNSDIDMYGFAIPPIGELLPHTKGEICGFGRQNSRFEQYQQNHVDYEKDVYDINIYNIAKFIHLCMENNPNMIDALFVPTDCILFTNTIGDTIRYRRREFLHKGAYFKFLGYARSQLSKIRNKNPEGKRKAIVDKYGYDVKYASHLYRLADECEQILTTRDLNLRRSQDKMLEIREGKVELWEIEKWFSSKEEYLKQCYEKSKIPEYPNEIEIKKLMIKCIEMYHGNLSKFGFPSI